MTSLVEKGFLRMLLGLHRRPLLWPILSFHKTKSFAKNQSERTCAGAEFYDVGRNILATTARCCEGFRSLRRRNKSADENVEDNIL